MFYARKIILFNNMIDQGERHYTFFKDQSAMQTWFKKLTDDQKVMIEAIGPCEFNERGILEYPADPDEEQTTFN